MRVQYQQQQHLKTPSCREYSTIIITTHKTERHAKHRPNARRSTQRPHCRRATDARPSNSCTRSVYAQNALHTLNFRYEYERCVVGRVRVCAAGSGRSRMISALCCDAAQRTSDVFNARKRLKGVEVIGIDADEERDRERASILFAVQLYLLHMKYKF